MSEVIEHGPIREPATALTVTPLTLIQLAVEKGANVEQLEKLFQLQLAWEQNEAKKAFVTALGAFKSNPPKIGKNKEVDFTSAKGRTHYKHASLDNVCDIIGAGLAKHGLSYRWKTEQQEGGLIRVGCILTHVLGHSEEVWLQARADETGNKNSIQAVGSTVTYLQRYTMLTATGMAVQDQDDDGRGGKSMPDQVKADWLAAIEAVADVPASEALWKQIATACTPTGDIPAYDALKAAMSKKVKALKATI